MNDSDQFKTQIDALRQRTLHIFDKLVEKTSQFELSKLPQAVSEYQQSLAANTYNVLVVGEAKRGKSSFVNALIGRELLPTDVDIATNQVFRISHAEHEAYRLRFEDESTQNISAQELIEYGSQTIAGQKGLSRPNLDLLRWIEVDVPIRFLTPGVSILDTPGLGSLYAAHAQITQRFVPHADAVIFVLDSNQPMVQFELDFLEALLKVTRHIFFIQTKIDLYDKEDWQRIQQRNEEILREHFKDGLDDTSVWPISSLNLMKAAQTNSPGLLKVSRQKELLDALQLFLFKVAGWYRCAEALVIADHCYTTGQTILAERLATLETKSTQELMNMHQDAEQRRQQMDAEWSSDRKKRRELHSKVQMIANSSKRIMIEFLDARSELETSLRQDIDAVKSIDEANKFGMDLSEIVITKVTSKWRELCEQANKQCSTLLGSFIRDINMLVLPPEGPKGVAHIGTDIDFPNDIWSKIDQAQTGFILGTNAGMAVVLITSAFIPLTLPVALIGIAIAGCLGAFQQWRYTAQSQLRQAQQKLHEHLSTVIQEVSKRFLYPDPMYDGQSLVNHYFDSFVQSVDEQIAGLVEEKSEEARQESERLQEQSSLDKQQRLAKAEQVRAHLAVWRELGHSIRTTADELNHLDLVPAASAASNM